MQGARLGLGLVLAAGVAGAASGAAAARIESGQWRVTSTGQMPGSAAKQHSLLHCLTAAEARDPAATIARFAQEAEKACHTDYRWTGSSLSWRLTCDQLMQLQSQGSVSFDRPDHFSGSMTNAMAGRPATPVAIDGVRIGTCGPSRE